MKTHWIKIAVIGITLLACTAMAQELTTNQIAAAELKQLIADEAKAAALTAKSILTPEQTLRMQEAEKDAEELTFLLFEASADAQKPTNKKAKFPKPVSTVSGELLGASVSGGGEKSLLPEEIECAPDPYRFYGVPTFTDSRWRTENDPPDYLPWSLTSSTVLPFSTNQAATSYPWYKLPGIYCQSGMYIQMTNNFDQYGDPQPHRLSFWYTLDVTTPWGGTFRASVAFIQGNTGLAHTNLAESALYKRVTLIVPPENGPDYPKIMFTAFKETTTPYEGLQARVDLVQWCTVETPMPVNGDFRIIRSQNNVMVEWSTIPYRVDKWVLQFAQDVEGPYEDDVSPIIYVNHTAYVSFPANYSARFYRLRHN